MLVVLALPIKWEIILDARKKLPLFLLEKAIKSIDHSQRAIAFKGAAKKEKATKRTVSRVSRRNRNIANLIYFLPFPLLVDVINVNFLFRQQLLYT